MKKQIINNDDIWSAGGSYVYLYTENDSVFNFLKRTIPAFGRYGKNGKIQGWQFLLPKDDLALLRHEISKNLTVEK